jgi:hypothetical protein
MVCLYCRDLYAFVWTEKNKALFKVANAGYKVSILKNYCYVFCCRWIPIFVVFVCIIKPRNLIVQNVKKNEILFFNWQFLFIFFSSIASDLCKNRLNGLMVRVLSTLYRVFDSLSVQTTDYTIGICCTKYKGLGTKTGCTEER